MSYYCNYINSPFSSWTLVICILTIIFFLYVFDQKITSPKEYFASVRNYGFIVLTYTMAHCAMVISNTASCQKEMIQSFTK